MMKIIHFEKSHIAYDNLGEVLGVSNYILGSKSTVFFFQIKDTLS